MDLQVELTVEGQRQWVALQDLSRTGMFLQVSRPIPIGTKVQVAFAVGDGKRVATAATVTHLLVPEDALRLGRYPGIGVQFREAAEPADQLFALAIERLCRAQRAHVPVTGLHLVIADGDTRMLQRQSNALAEAGFSVATATTGMEAIAACLRKRPDVIVIDRALPVFDGFRVLETLAQDGTLVTVPAIVTSADLNDLAPAFERGAMDFIAKPFTTLELIVRARRLAHSAPRASERVILAGTLSDLPLAALLQMLAVEKKTGRIAMTGEHVAWIDIVDGRIASAGAATGETDPRAILMSLLDWKSGSFELTAIAGPHDGDLALPITHLLLEHACLRDEQSRGVSGITPPRKRCSTAPELLVADTTDSAA
jgi:CheY-like chemotaxis protein